MKQFALIVTLFFGIGLTQIEAQTNPACCSPEWCKIFCGEKATNCSTASLKDCKPSDCKKVASTAKASSCAPKAAASTVASTSCTPKAAASTAVAKTVANKTTSKSACCAWIPGCCKEKSVSKAALKSCAPAKAKEVKNMALAVKEE